MFCTHCGALIDDDARFCNKCGAPVAHAGAAPGDEPPVADGLDVPVDETRVMSDAPDAAPTDAASGTDLPAGDVATREVPPAATSYIPAARPSAAPGAAGGQQRSPYATSQFPSVAPAPQGPPPAGGHSTATVVAAVCATVAVIAVIALAVVLLGQGGRGSEAPSAVETPATVAATAPATEAPATTQPATSEAPASTAASPETTAAATTGTVPSADSQFAGNTTVIIIDGGHSYPVPAPRYQGTYVLPDSASTYYSRSELEGLSNWDLYIARNEIYARHGRMFRNDDLQYYFNHQPWYTARYSPDEFDAMGGVLNDCETSNASTMLAIEQERGSSYIQ